jgi:NAD-dependent dihydropyrimidine dehydrogenase PreA subunit
VTYVICEPCIGTKDQSCVEACPVDCIHPHSREAGFDDEPQLYIDPDTCIDCGACEPVCPVTAIFAESDVPEQWKADIQKNADYYKR